MRFAINFYVYHDSLTPHTHEQLKSRPRPQVDDLANVAVTRVPPSNRKFIGLSSSGDVFEASPKTNYPYTDAFMGVQIPALRKLAKIDPCTFRIFFYKHDWAGRGILMHEFLQQLV